VRVGFITDAQEIGGSEVWLAEVLPRLQDYGIAPLAAFPEGGKTKPIIVKLETAGIPVVQYQNYEELPPVDLWVSSAWFPKNFARMLKSLPRPHYALVHDQIEIYYPLGLHRLYRLGYRLLKAPLLRQADGVITVSRWAAEFLKNVHRVPNVHYVQNGVDTSRFRPPDPKEKERLKQEFGLEGIIALLPARFAISLEKNQITALLVAKHFSEITLILAGDGPLLKTMKNFAQIMGIKNSIFLGRTERMPELYRAADIFIFPTLGENQSLATLEAMASGLPIITSHIPAQEELITPCEEGILLPAEPTPFAKYLKLLANNEELRNRLGRSARKKVLKKHTLEKSAEKLAQKLKELIENEAAHS